LGRAVPAVAAVHQHARFFARYHLHHEVRRLTTA
jgi:hypothetical protein